MFPALFRKVVRNFNGGWVIVIMKPCCVEGPVVSVTVTKKEYVPAVVGVPEMAPVVGLRLSPGGGEPLITVHVQGQLSGAATRVAV